MKLLPTLARTAAAAGLIGATMVFVAPAASAQQCSTVPGYAKKVSNGVVEYYEEGRCGTDPNRLPAPPPRPNPAPKAPVAGDGCLSGIIGDAACGRTGSNVTVPPFDWNIRNGVHIPTGTVTVGNTTRISGGGASGTVSIGPITPIKDKDNQDTSAK